jgi:hypothetical protein
MEIIDGDIDISTLRGTSNLFSEELTVITHCGGSLETLSRFRLKRLVLTPGNVTGYATAGSSGYPLAGYTDPAPDLTGLTTSMSDKINTLGVRKLFGIGML